MTTKTVADDDEQDDDRDDDGYGGGDEEGTRHAAVNSRTLSTSLAPRPAASNLYPSGKDSRTSTSTFDQSLSLFQSEKCRAIVRLSGIPPS